MSGGFRKQVDDEAKRLARQKMAKYFAYSRQQQQGTTFSGAVDPNTKKITAPNGQQYDGIPLGNVSQRLDAAVVVNSTQAVYIDESSRFRNMSARRTGMFLHTDGASLFVRGHNREEMHSISSTLLPHLNFFGGDQSSKGFSWAGVLDDNIVLVYWDKWISKTSPTAPTIETGSRFVYIVHLKKVKVSSSQLRIGSVESFVIPWTETFFETSEVEYSSPGIQKLNYSTPYGPVSTFDSWGDWSAYSFSYGGAAHDGLVSSTLTTWDFRDGPTELVESMMPSLVLYRNSNGDIALGALVSYHRLFKSTPTSYFVSLESERGFTSFSGYQRTIRTSLSFSGFAPSGPPRYGSPLYSGTYSWFLANYTFTDQTINQIRQTVESGSGDELILADILNYTQMPTMMNVGSDAGVFVMSDLLSSASVNSAAARLVSGTGLEMQVLDSLHFPDQGGIVPKKYTCFGLPQIAYDTDSGQLFGGFTRFVQSYLVTPPNAVDSSLVDGFGGRERVDHYSISAPNIEMVNFSFVGTGYAQKNSFDIPTRTFENPAEYLPIRVSSYNTRAELQNFDLHIGTTAAVESINLVGNNAPVVVNPLYYAVNVPGTPVEASTYTGIISVNNGPNFVGNPQFVSNGFQTFRKVVKAFNFDQVQVVTFAGDSVLKYDFAHQSTKVFKDRFLLNSFIGGYSLVDFSL